VNLKQLKNVSGAHKASMPEFIPPQLATLVDKPPEGDNWFHELKFDGYRLICHLDNGKIRFWTRNRKDWTAKFPHLGKAVKSLPVKSAILDGEIVAVDSSGHTSFQKLQQSIKSGDASFLFQVFDLIYLEGFNLTRTPLRERKRLLAELLDSVDERSPLRYSDHVEGNGEAFFAQACAYKIEGTVSKAADSPYESTRTRNWLKIKCLQRQEFVIVGYLPSDKGFPGFGALILGVYEKGKLVFAGRVGTGFKVKERVALQKKLDALARKTMPFAEKPRDPGLRNAVWAEPKLIGEVAFSEWTEDGSVRHPSFQGLRLDKKAKDVVRELPAE
jgi:bifunctional non-homologous end joining protein LigD